MNLAWRTARNDIPSLLAELAPLLSADREAESGD